MKFIILLSALVAVALCAEPVAIVRSASDVDPDGSFSFGYETGDGTSHDASGNADGVQGKFSFTSPEGTKYDVTYVANAEGGFQAQGAHFPVGPEVPQSVLRALAWNEAHPEENDQ